MDKKLWSLCLKMHLRKVFCHASVGWHLVATPKFWMPAYAGMTNSAILPHALCAQMLLLCACMNNFELTGMSVHAKTQDLANRDDVSNSVDNFERPQHNRLHVMVDPSPDSGELSQRIYNVEIGNNAPSVIALQQSKMVHGKIRFTAPRVRTLLSNDEGIQDDYVVMLSKEADAMHEIRRVDIDADGNFNVRVLDNQDVWLLTNPKGQFQKAPSFYPLQIKNQNARVDDRVQFIESDDVIMVTGTLKVNELIKMPKDGAWNVSIYQAGMLVSSLATLSNGGDFSLKLSSNLPYGKNEKAELRVSFVGINSCFPNLVKSIHIDGQKNIKLGDIFVFNTALLSRVKIEVKKDNNDPLKNIPLYIMGKIGDDSCSLETITDSSGMLELYVLAGEYEFAAVPSFVDNLDSRYRERSINSAAPEKISFHLKELTPVKGVLYDNEGNPVFGANMQFREISSKVARLVERVTGKGLIRTDAQTDETGRWCAKKAQDHATCEPVYLDEGQFEVMVEPPAGTALPYYASEITFDGMQALEMRLQEAVLIDGRVVNFSKEFPVSGAFVSLYASHGKLDNFMRPIAKTFTNAAGEFRAYVAPTMIAG